MLHVLLVWILDTLHQIDYATQQSSQGEYCLVHHMPTCSRCTVMMLSINLRCEYSHICSHNIANAFRTLLLIMRSVVIPEMCHATTGPPKIGPPGPFMAAAAGPRTICSTADGPYGPTIVP